MKHSHEGKERDGDRVKKRENNRGKGVNKSWLIKRKEKIRGGGD